MLSETVHFRAISPLAKILQAHQVKNIDSFETYLSSQSAELKLSLGVDTHKWQNQALAACRAIGDSTQRYKAKGQDIWRQTKRDQDDGTQGNKSEQSEPISARNPRVHAGDSHAQAPRTRSHSVRVGTRQRNPFQVPFRHIISLYGLFYNCMFIYKHKFAFLLSKGI